MIIILSPAVSDVIERYIPDVEIREVVKSLFEIMRLSSFMVSLRMGII